MVEAIKLLIDTFNENSREFEYLLWNWNEDDDKVNQKDIILNELI